ncbi:MAG: TROVE domain-containing protein [Firmicutes bacterium]|nr:TROVE domain-containing protein [Bacillota bacterium]
MKTNAKALDYRLDTTARTAGGYGPYAAKQDPEALLRRSVMACLLWEDNFYEDGRSNADNIMSLIPQVEPQKVFDIAVEARTKQKLRHVPLLIAREMARLDTHKGLVGKLLPRIILRADELSEFLALYWKDGRQPLSKQVKVGLAQAFHNFDEYQFGKYAREEQVKLRDVMFLAHPNPGQKQELFKRIANDELAVPDTWEVALSTGKDKKETWTRLIEERKLGALAFLRNISNMEKAGVSRHVIQQGFDTINPRWLLPLNYFAAARHAPKWEREIEALMLRGLAQAPRLPGYTIFIVDVSGSMTGSISAKSEYSRLDVAAAMALIASETCEHISIYATAGNDSTRTHKTILLRPHRGFALCEEIRNMARVLGGGGIFTRQCLEYINRLEAGTPDRVIVFSDSQDCDLPDRGVPKPFGKKNYIVDVSAHSRGINYEGVWTAEISGWSEHFMDYIFAYEGLNPQGGDQE